jgi:TRAP-type C4-dicarboxylate transport system permease large subunit
MDMTPVVLIFIPIFLPIITELGMDTIQFGIVLVINLCVGFAHHLFAPCFLWELELPTLE